MQDDLNANARSEPFVFAKTQVQAIDTANIILSDTYMADVTGLFPSLPEVSQSDKLLLSKKQRFGVLTGMSKELAEMVSLNEELFEKTKGVLAQELAGLRGEDDVRDPFRVKTKGRPKKSRFVSSLESKKARRRV